MIKKINNKKVRLTSDGSLTNEVVPTSLTYLNSVLVNANTIKPPDTIFIRSKISKSGTTDPFTLRLYWNTGVTVSAAVQLATVTLLATNRTLDLNRRIFFSDNNNGRMFSTTQNVVTDFGGSTSALSLVTITDWLTTDGYFFMTCDAVAGGVDSIIGINLSLEI